MNVGIRDFAGNLGLVRQVHTTPAAFGEAVRPHLPRMLRLAARLGPASTEDDVVQEALIRAWRKLGQFDSKRGTFASWLLAIVANEARRARSQERKPISVQSRPMTMTADAQVDLAAAIDRLPPRQRLAVDCYYFAGLSVPETAAVMVCTEGTVKSTLADARAKLHAELQER